MSGNNKHSVVVKSITRRPLLLPQILLRQHVCSTTGLRSFLLHELSGLVFILQATRQSVLLVCDGNEMNVVGHQAIADKFYPVSLDALLQQVEIDAPLRGCDFFNFPCSLWLESSEEHLPTSIAGVPSATLRTSSSTARHKPSIMR